MNGGKENLLENTKEDNKIRRYYMNDLKKIQLQNKSPSKTHCKAKVRFSCTHSVNSKQKRSKSLSD